MNTAISTAVADALAAVAGIGAEIKALEEQAKLRRREALEPFLNALAASGKVSIITVRGDTPGFNDGEPCEHSVSVFVNIAEHAGDEVGNYGFDDFVKFRSIDEDGEAVDLDSEEFYELLGEGDDAEKLAICNAAGHIYEKPSAEIMAAINTLILTTAEEDNDTDYFVTYVLKDGKFAVMTGAYDCGY